MGGDGEEGKVKVSRDSHPLYQRPIDAHADHDKKALKGQRKQPSQVVGADVAPLLIDHRGEGDGCG